MDQGESGIDVIVRHIDDWVDFKPNKAWPGRIEYETHTGDPACDVYVYTRPPLPEAEEGETQWAHGHRVTKAMRSSNPPGCDSWFMVAFDAHPGPGAEIVKTIINGRGVRTSLVRLTDGAYLKSSLINDEGSERKWGVFNKGKREPVSPGEAASMGIEETTTSAIELVVSPHIAVFSFLVQEGVVTGNARLLNKATAADVAGKHIAGSVPVEIASAAKSVTTLQLSRPLPATGPVTVSDVRERFLRLSRFSVSGC